jgi:glycosyltransferase involved in cell wall biosynthesis
VGTAAYMDAIQFITKSFDATFDSPYELHLVVNGSTQQMKEVQNCISSLKKSDRVKCFSNLKYPDLIQKYIDATALLIPLTDGITDRARFPQKISEYLASGNPIVTTNFGEVPYYFKDRENAFIASAYDVEEYASKLQYIIENPEESAAVGSRGKETGKKYFDYSSYASQIRKLITNLQLTNIRK